MPFFLTLEEFTKLFQIRVCECCGKQLRFQFGDKRWDVWTLDRKDPRMGYTTNNTGVLCYGCNRKKNNITLDDLNQLTQYMRGPPTLATVC